MIGLLGVAGLSALIIAGFPGTQIESPPVLAVTALVLVAVALLASYLPARRAGRISPVDALRAE